MESNITTKGGVVKKYVERLLADSLLVEKENESEKFSVETTLDEFTDWANRNEVVVWEEDDADVEHMEQTLKGIIEMALDVQQYQKLHKLSVKVNFGGRYPSEIDVYWVE